MINKNIRQNLYLRILLFPLSISYGVLVHIRNVLFDLGIFKSQRFDVPIISVGNITAGGTGKTPMTMWILNLLKTDFKRIVVVSRGYGRKTKGVIVVSDGEGTITTAEEGGDEPVLIARKCPQYPVVVAEKRSQAIKKALSDYQPDLILLDDAFQHRWVYRHCDIVLINAGGKIHREYLLPLGNLREPLKSIIRADIIILTKIDGEIDPNDKTLLEKSHFKTIFYSKFLPDIFVNLDLRVTTKIDELKGQKVIAFAGISEPELFRQFLENKHVVIKDFIIYPDHHPYGQKDLNDLFSIARKYNCKYIVTTEKDIVKINQPVGADIELLALSLKIQMSDSEKLKQNILTCIDKTLKNGYIEKL